jgi:tRNA uridine 5-carboxymethylaminomethyl modification enzyme
MRGLMHTGEQKTGGGRAGERSAAGLSASLERMGFELGRLKTGTPPRLAAETIDFDRLPPQVGDEQPVPFSDLTPQALPGRRFPGLPQARCWMTSTTTEAHELIRANLHRAPMYSGQIEAECGPRYCPSIEDKIVRFPDRESHHVFLEPESLHTNEIYCNGISTSLPVDVQERFVCLMPGCARAKVLRWGYAVEYDMIWPHQIDATLMTKSIEGLFPAGQINCTTGYEEAAGQGLRLRRDQAYIGVMLDDLVTKTPREPYRMFTSRAEHRLLLRADNADERLTPLGRELDLVDDQQWAGFRRRLDQLSVIRDRFNRLHVGGRSLREHARRPEVTVDEVLGRLDEPFDRRLVERAMTESRYEGYIVRHRAEIRRQAKADRQRVPAWLDFRAVAGLRTELSRFRPATMGQAGRLAGVNPADLTLLAVAIRRGPGAAQASQPAPVHTG